MATSKPAGARSPRLLASHAVQLVAEQGLNSDAALVASGISRLKSPRDAAFATSIMLGTLRWYQQMDRLLELLLDKPLARKHSDLRHLLLSALFQLSHTEIAPHGVVSDSVDGVLQLQKKWARGLVNAVLRNYLRKRSELDHLLHAEPVSRWSHPAWLIDAFKAAWPEHWQQLLDAGNQRAPMSLRVNRLHGDRQHYLDKLAAMHIEASASDLSEDGIVLRQAMPTDDLPGFGKGQVSVQDIAAQLAAPIVAPSAGQRVLDACAAPGGKTAHMLEFTARHIDMTALEINAERCERLRDNLQRLDLQASILNADASDPSTWWDGRPFDRILLDAPCSGTGVIRRHPDIKLLRKRADIKTLADRQRSLLNGLWPLLAKGGRLVYATCSVLPQENEQLIKDFLSANDDARPQEIVVNCGLKRDTGIQILTGESDMDGFFYASLQKT
jgi:16S rRNA (cytosine967-C5)-methyltransferase